MGAAISLSPAPLPEAALLQRYATREHCYTDCFSVDVSSNVSLSQVITAFYTAPLFRVERLILKIAAKRPSTDQDVSNLADTLTTTFAAWSVEGREDDQILLKDMAGRTRSWLMVRSSPIGTTLYFGSAVTPPENETELGFIFKALLGFHKVYSKALLRGAQKSLSR
jgi:hypothetical protein